MAVLAEVAPQWSQDSRSERILAMPLWYSVCYITTMPVYNETDQNYITYGKTMLTGDYMTKIEPPYNNKERN